jgi:DNA polymerase-3 subunit delta'
MIFPSTLIISTQPQPQVDAILHSLEHQSVTNDPDIFFVEDNNITSIRLIDNFLTKKPYNHKNKIVYIPNIDSFHLEAQNALLKILEEPGDNNYFILTTNHPQKVINTISSRCQIINLSSSSITTTKIFFPDNQLHDDIPDIKSFLAEQLTLHQQELINNPSNIQKNNVAKLIKSLKMIDSNVDPKSALDFFLLS